MSRECPCCGQLVPGEDEILSPEERESLTKYVDHLADKAKERKAREGKKLSEAQARIEALEAALRAIEGECAGLVDEIIYAREMQKLKIDSAPMEDTFRRFRNACQAALENSK